MPNTANDGTTLSDFINSAIRTYSPILVGAVVAALSKWGVILDPEAIEGFEFFIGSLASAIWWTVVRLLERKWPNFGLLLGVRKAPVYVEPDEAGVHNITSMNRRHDDPPVAQGAIAPTGSGHTWLPEDSEDEDASYDGQD